MSTFEVVRKELAKLLEISPESITADTRIIEDLGADSLDVVELVMELEERYNIIITNDKAGDLSTVGAIVAFIEKHVQQ